jgi:hypothetical protein
MTTFGIHSIHGIYGIHSTHSAPMHAGWQPSAPRSHVSPCGRQNRLPLTGSARASSSDVTEQGEYVRVNASISDASRTVSALVRVLEALPGHGLVDPSERQGLHPCVIPLAQTGTGTGSLIGLLRLPKATSASEMQVVSMDPSQGSTYLRLLARTPDEYLHRTLAETDFAGDQDVFNKVAGAAGEYGLKLYQQGDVANSKLPTLNAYLTRHVGMFLDVAEQLVQAHFDKGDQMSALITAEWYMRDGQFPNWGTPYEYVSDLMIGKLNRKEEGRDIARLALKTPWWTLSKGFEHTRSNSGLTGDADAVRRVLLEQEEANMSALSPGKPFKSNEEERIEEAGHLMNKVVAGDYGSWADIAGPLEEKYELAGLIDMARFIAMIH